MPNQFTIMPTPVGDLLLTADDDGLTGVWFDEHRRGPEVPAGAPRADGLLADAVAQFADYFAGRRRRFDLPLAPRGTPFQLRVWALLREIPYGETTSYGALARRLADARATRAVGLANGRNPLSIVVPCHRVVGADGSLIGYGGGLDRKRRLLDLEAGVLPLPA